MEAAMERRAGPVNLEPGCTRPTLRQRSHTFAPQRTQSNHLTAIEFYNLLGFPAFISHICGLIQNAISGKHMTLQPSHDHSNMFSQVTRPGLYPPAPCVLQQRVRWNEAPGDVHTKAHHKRTSRSSRKDSIHCLHFAYQSWSWNMVLKG